MSNRNTRDVPTLVETLPASLVAASWKNHIIALGIPTALVGLTISVGAGLHSGWQASLLLSLIAWPLSAILVLGTANGVHQHLTTQIPTVELRNAELIVRYGHRKLSAKVADCHLRRGRGISMRLIGGVKLYSWLPVILIDFPPHWNPRIGMRLGSRNTVAVGYTGDMLNRWERALLQCKANQPTSFILD